MTDAHRAAVSLRAGAEALSDALPSPGAILTETDLPTLRAWLRGMPLADRAEILASLREHLEADVARRESDARHAAQVGAVAGRWARLATHLGLRLFGLGELADALDGLAGMVRRGDGDAAVAELVAIAGLLRGPDAPVSATAPTPRVADLPATPGLPVPPEGH